MLPALTFSYDSAPFEIDLVRRSSVGNGTIESHPIWDSFANASESHEFSIDGAVMNNRMAESL